MMAMSSRTPRRRPRLAGIALLLGVVAVAIPLQASEPLDIHDGLTPGFYNEEHVLAVLDSVVGDGPVPEVTTGFFVALVAAACVLASGTRISAPAVCLADSRAPPLA